MCGHYITTMLLSDYVTMLNNRILCSLSVILVAFYINL